MTKRHYISIAAVFRKQVDRARANGDTHAFAAVHDCIVEISDVMRADNPRFDRVAFMEACGLDII